MEKKAFAYRVPIGDYNYLQCRVPFKPLLRVQIKWASVPEKCAKKEYS